MQAKEAMAGELIRQFIENMENWATREQAMELIKRQKEEEECKV